MVVKKKSSKLKKSLKPIRKNLSKDKSTKDKSTRKISVKLNKAKSKSKKNYKKLNFIIMGPQGCGKGTQAQLLSEKLSIPHISTGDIFRELEKKDTPLGKEIRRLIDNGLLAPDELTNEVVKERISRFDCKKGFILDGYPRNLSQAHFLENISDLSKCIFIELSEEEAVNRISSRKICSLCKADYNLVTMRPKRENRCDKCSGTLITRADDKPELVRKRLRDYHLLTEPLIEFYAHKKILIRVNGEQKVDSVFKELLLNIKK